MDKNGAGASLVFAVTNGEHQVPTPMDKLTTDEKKKHSLNAKALNVLFCALGQDEFARVSSCKSAKEAWKLLEATHEGDKDTKATKIALGTSEYENFKMKVGESIQDMNKRFNLIVNNLSHIKPECPKLKKKEELKKGKKKALKVTWDDLNSDESDSDQSQEENVNACFMASNDEEEEAWKLLEATHEGDKDTKATKIVLRTSEYENFKMKAGESIQDMNKHFNLIVNNLSKLNKVYPTSDINTKIIFSLPREWHSLVVNLLPKYADVETSTIWSSLYSHKLLLKKMKEEEHVPIVKKTMALKVDDRSESEGESDEKLAMFKRYKKFIKRNKGESSKKFPPKKGKSNQVTCYECGNIGHIKPECPKLKKKEELRKGKKKALKVTWDEEEDKLVRIYECTLLYLLLTHKKINLPSIIIQHMYESSGRQNRPYGMLLTHIFAKRGILEVRPSRIRFLDAECLGYCGLVNIGDDYYMKREFQKLDTETQAEYGPRRSMSSLPSTSKALEAEANANTEVPVRAPRVK
ncbi:unnamed protein product [Cuscuta campestris]|uniref:CCHC-type domain-containing protein n=1 Tax=Cuscuta campestris TaxID=132261 RepID=A0A484LY03_9ASTE|nr:unnamed protein product [Cuscuta campestris]